jgi:hypothetical protein
MGVFVVSKKQKQRTGDKLCNNLIGASINHLHDICLVIVFYHKYFEQWSSRSCSNQLSATMYIYIYKGKKKIEKEKKKKEAREKQRKKNLTSDCNSCQQICPHQELCVLICRRDHLNL